MLTEKTKQLKTSEASLKNSEKRVKELTDQIINCNKKISELETDKIRLQLIADQATQAAAIRPSTSQHRPSRSRSTERHRQAPKNNKKVVSPKSDSRSNTSGSPPQTRRSGSESSPKNLSRCKTDNIRTCRREKCPDVHASKTCQNFSKLGSCPYETTGCEHRHPKAVCYDWRNHGYCGKADNCRYRHPLYFPVEGF